MGRIVFSLVFLLLSFTQLCAQDSISFSRCDQLPDDIPLLSGYHFYVFGEMHDEPQTMSARLGLIKYLNEKEGINEVFLEIGKGAAWLYNQYLQTGDTTWVTSPKLVFYRKAEDKTFWHELYEYNKTCKNKLTISGFDFERLELLKFLQFQKVTHNYPDAIRATMSFLDTEKVADVNSDTLAKVVQRFKGDLEKNDADYRNVFGPNYPLVCAALHNQVSFEHYNNRDSDIYYNLDIAKREQSNSKFVMFIGRNHIIDKKATRNLGTVLEMNPGVFLCVEDVAKKPRSNGDFQFHGNSKRVRKKAHGRETSTRATFYLKSN